MQFKQIIRLIMANGPLQKWWDFSGLVKNATKPPWEKLQSAKKQNKNSTGLNMEIQQTGKLRKLGSAFLSFNYPFHMAISRGI